MPPSRPQLRLSYARVPCRNCSSSTVKEMLPRSFLHCTHRWPSALRTDCRTIVMVISPLGDNIGAESREGHMRQSTIPVGIHCRNVHCQRRAGANDLPDQSRRDPCRREVRSEGRVSRRARCWRHSRLDQWARRPRGARQERRGRAARRRRRPFRLLGPQCHDQQGGPLHGRGERRRCQGERDVAGVRHQWRTQGQERHPVRRRRHDPNPPDRGARPVEGHRRGPLRRRSRDGGHAAHGHGLHLRHRCDRDRQRQQRGCLYDRPQVLQQRARHLLRAQQEFL